MAFIGEVYMAQIYDLIIYQGSSFRLDVELKNQDLTGAELRGQIRSRATSEDIIAEFSFEEIDFELGKFSIVLDSTSTESIPTKGIKHSDFTTYYYDVEVEINGFVRRILMGSVSVSPEITK